MTTSLALASNATAWAHGWGPGPGFGFGFLFLLIPLFWIGVVILIISLVGRRFRRNAIARGYGPGFGRGPGSWGSGTRSAEQTLAERFAQGDIEEVEYRARLEVLRANRDGGQG